MEIKSEVSVVILCKGRLKYLKETLPFTLSQEGLNYSVTVVDYGCPDNTFEELMDLNYPNLQLISVLEDTKFINRSHGRNIGAVNTTGKFLMFQDAEIFTPSFFLLWLKSHMEKGPYYLARAMQPCTHKQGTFMICREVFEKIRGFEESFQGWGSEEDDLYERAEQSYRHTHRLAHYDERYTFRFDASLLEHIDHSDASRTEFDREPDRWKSQAKNISMKRARRTLDWPDCLLANKNTQVGEASIERMSPTEVRGFKRYDTVPTSWEWANSKGAAALEALNEVRGTF